MVRCVMVWAFLKLYVSVFFCRTRVQRRSVSVLVWDFFSEGFVHDYDRHSYLIIVSPIQISRHLATPFESQNEDRTDPYS